MDIKQVDFIAGAVSFEQFPQTSLPEIAFIGRSNVGKSSLINSLIRRKNFARTSSTPGKTQQINFFTVNNIFSFADLPGFGYASVGKEQRELFKKINQDYLQKRENLKFVCTLADARHEPMELDLALFEWLESINRKFIILMTKSDKLSKTQIESRKNEFIHLVQNCSNFTEVLPYSSITNLGREELWGVIKKHSK